MYQTFRYQSSGVKTWIYINAFENTLNAKMEGSERVFKTIKNIPKIYDDCKKVGYDFEFLGHLA